MFRFGFIALLNVFSSMAALADEGTLVNVDPRMVYAPVGFDDNDEAEVVVEGFLLGDCYRLASPEVVVDIDARTILIKPMARRFEGPCREILVPFNFTAKLGQLIEGEYQITVPGPTFAAQEVLAVKHAAGVGPDDFPYLPVDSVMVQLDRVSHHMVATLKGRFTNSCMRWSEARIQDNGKTINLLPVMKFDSLTHCNAIETEYEQRVVLPNSIGWGRHLLHVRTLNGQAINHLFYKL